MKIKKVHGKLKMKTLNWILKTEQSGMKLENFKLKTEKFKIEI